MGPLPLQLQDLRKWIVAARTERELRKERERSRCRLRKRISPADREVILGKTGGRCHICGGEIDGSQWQADHVLAHSGGGAHHVDNYLPAHGSCNHYRWDYLPEEFELILRLGVYVKTQIEHGSQLGKDIEDRFLAHERRRLARRRGSQKDR